MFRLQSLLQMDFSSEYGARTKRAKKRCLPNRSFFLDMNTEFLKLHIICIRTDEFYYEKI